MSTGTGGLTALQDCGVLQQEEEAVDGGEAELFFVVEHRLAQQHHQVIAQLGALALQREERAEERGGRAYPI